ncbi:MAG: 2-C-methyl-D-erythritol 2,4-cyclodiphosphate synthase [Candidatus Cloacimonetes bacterium]|nr:2-C-methyl-D-erythritol 2,4-cyclodiphosphate synthase [Candidatus Cloacimonadota bacterium]MBL7086024.1 2-C-methyl-D-erythritol 2,4-cyclodiphosphate synthase [Candidatus Cloacimonadota bacterium]
MRIGFGYDVHPLVKDRKLILGGVEIPFEKGLAGHSDGDALIHAIIDALFGAVSLGDIGSHFPDTDQKYKDISSLILLEETGKILANKKFRIINIDSTIVLEKPKLQIYIPSMKSNIADKLDIEITQISIKATREEGLGFVGRGEGIKVYAVALIDEFKPEC